MPTPTIASQLAKTVVHISAEPAVALALTDALMAQAALVRSPDEPFFEIHPNPAPEGESKGFLVKVTDRAIDITAEASGELVLHRTLRADTDQAFIEAAAHICIGFLAMSRTEPGLQQEETTAIDKQSEPSPSVREVVSTPAPQVSKAVVIPSTSVARPRLWLGAVYDVTLDGRPDPFDVLGARLTVEGKSNGLFELFGGGAVGRRVYDTNDVHLSLGAAQVGILAGLSTNGRRLRVAGLVGARGRILFERIRAESERIAAHDGSRAIELGGLGAMRASFVFRSRLSLAFEIGFEIVALKKKYVATTPEGVTSLSDPNRARPYGALSLCFGVI